MDGQTYDILSASRIAPATAAFNLYVLHQPAWKPTYPKREPRDDPHWLRIGPSISS